LKKSLLLFTIIIAFAVQDVRAQFKNYNVKGGIKYEQLIPFSEFSSAYSFTGRGFIGFEITNNVAIEIGAGYGQFKTEDDYNSQTGLYNPDTVNAEIKTDIIPVDLRIRLSPWAKTAKNWNPYFYVGAGIMNYKVQSVPGADVSSQYSIIQSGFSGIFPVGLGTEIRMSKNVMLDFSGGFTYTTSDVLNNFEVPSFNDCAANVALGITFAGGDDCDTDNDRDGLTKCREEQIGTDPNVADTDGDGLNDGDEVNRYMTDPLNRDTDGDGLTDGDEVLKYLTNPLSKDTDSDGLTDYEEIFTYNTLPNNRDTDGDGLTDGDEVLIYRTDPRMVDTDLGSIGDGVEVNRGTDPLNPDDDLPKPPVVEPMQVGAVIILEGINFASGSYEISAGSDAILEQAYSTMLNNPEIIVEISGHTDSRGGYEMNMELSRNRAESVKGWLVAKGIDGSRIETAGYGQNNPIASNDSEEGRYQNRRIEFKRIR
jgi:outer membrane protein OmpA-like peptidoglycan-associated protein